MKRTVAQHKLTQSGQSIQDIIIETFLAAHGAFVSGSLLSERTGISRTAIWKHIKQLETLGFVFESVPRKGYRATQIPDLLLAPMLRAYLPQGGSLGSNVHWFADAGSTNLIAAQLAADGANHGTVVAAGSQHGGRGRRSKPWFAPKTGLWFSVILKKPFPLRRAAELTLITSVIVRRVLARHTGLSIDIKWPNDLLCNRRKISGILAEIRADGENVEYAVLGIGINTNIPTDKFPSDLQAIATSLLAESGQPVMNAHVAADILSEFEPFYEDLIRGGQGFMSVIDEWRSASATLGTHVRIQAPLSIIEGTATRVDDDGVLYVVDETGKETPIYSGDILF